ncbi:MAG: tyrosine 2,3-aminomutase [Legionella sp.]|jgi:histidine ammonia-lyase
MNTAVLDICETPTIAFTGTELTRREIFDIAFHNHLCEISSETREKIKKSRAQFEAIVEQNIPIYGVTTGYGEMVYVLVDKEKETELQTNLIRSHCAGVGDYFSKAEARAMLAARINAFCKGYSAVSEKLVDQLVLYLNKDIIPVIPKIGSLGASGDLGPLSHMAATLIGEGYVFDENEQPTETQKILEQHHIQALQLKFKEGLAMINGTSAMTGLGAILLTKSFEQVKQAEIITALVLENQKASDSPFQSEGHDLARPHSGQIDCAKNLRTLLQGSKLIESHRTIRDNLAAQKTSQVSATNVYLQKAYTLRCVPQIVGAIRETLYHADRVLNTEINSSNDNPLFFEDKEIFHGGNFHGQPIAFVMDFTAIALTQLGIVSERRTNRLLNRHLNNGLPEFLVKKDPGLNCGFAGAQYPATALIAENRTICSPASIQSVPSNGDNQDVVSMGLIAARNAMRILQNNYYILAVELLAAAQAIDIAGHYEKLSGAAQIAYNTVRSFVPTLDEDRYMSDDIYKIAKVLEQGKLLENIEQAGIKLI